jgi:diguanylate cyclase (GGDEF)-like protein
MPRPTRPPAAPATPTPCQSSPIPRARADVRTSFAGRLAEALSLWSRRRGDRADPILQEFAGLVAEARDAWVVEAALVRLAFQVAGRGVLRVELLRDLGWGQRRVAAWPRDPAGANNNATSSAIAGAPTTTILIDLPMRCGGSERGTLRIAMDGSQTLGPDPRGRLATLAVLAAVADRCQGDDADKATTAPPSTHDMATGLPNAAFLDSFLTYALALADRRNEPLSLLYIGVDRLAAIRELHGPEIAAEALRKVSRTIAGTLRTSDLIARLDDGRLVAVLPGALVDNARVVAETVRTSVAVSGIATPNMPLLTASIGVATFPDHAGDVPSLRSAAAAALSVARSKGHDQVATAPLAHLSEPPTLLRIAQYAG